MIGRGQTVYDWRHYLAVVQRKPGALRNGAPFAELPDAFRTLQQHLLKKPGGDREMVDILALVLQHDEQAVLWPWRWHWRPAFRPRPMSSTCCIAWSTANRSRPRPSDAPQALTLTNEPKPMSNATMP
jgi:hypothetical protein